MQGSHSRKRFSGTGERYLKAKFPLVAVSIILAFSLAGNVSLYLCQPNSVPANALQKQITDLQNQISNSRNQINTLLNDIATLESQTVGLNNQVGDLQNQTSSLQTENSKLKSKNAELSLLSQEKAPAKLVTRLGANDLRYNYSGQAIRLYITGEVWNVGTEMAQNCSLHVILYQGATVAQDTYISLGNIAGASFSDVATNIYYTGEALTNWTITSEHN
jgi:hypothetical protein